MAAGPLRPKQGGRGMARCINVILVACDTGRTRPLETNRTECPHAHCDTTDDVVCMLSFETDLPGKTVDDLQTPYMR